MPALPDEIDYNCVTLVTKILYEFSGHLILILCH